MNQTEAKALIIDVRSGIAPEADFAAPSGKAQLRDELDLDSMDFLNFVAALQERTKLDIPETDYPNLFSMDGAIAYLGKNRGSERQRSHSGGRACGLYSHAISTQDC